MSSRAETPTGNQQLADSESDAADADGSEQESVETEAEQAPESLSLDTIFEILKNQRRRYVLQYLRETEGGAQLNELADQVAAWENDKPVGLISSNERKRVYVGLYQCHLTKMDDSGVINFDQYRGSIEVRPQIEQLYEYIDFGEEAEDEETDKSRLFYPAAAGGAVALGLLGLAIPSITIGLHGFLLTTVFAAAVLGVSTFERLSERELSLGDTLRNTDETH